MLTFLKKILENSRGLFFAKIFREIWTVAPGRITFAKCAFSFFVFHGNVMNFHQNRQHANMLWIHMVFGCLGMPKSHFSQKLPAEPIFQHFWQKSPYTTPVTVILGQNGVKWRKSALFAKKCTFGPFGLPGGLQNHYVYPFFWPRAPFVHILAKKCTF